MAAQQIPNLLSQRGNHGLRGRRGRYRGSFAAANDDHESFVSRRDQIILETDVDANVSRISAVTAGYLVDPFAEAFTLQPPARRLPIINRGTYVRTTALDRIVHTFLDSIPGDKQIISLGAGTDTRYLRLSRERRHEHLLYHEIDFPTVSAQKLAIIKSSPKLSPKGTSFHHVHNPAVPLKPLIQRWGFWRMDVRTRGYLFHPYDLRLLGTPRMKSSGEPMIISQDRRIVNGMFTGTFPLDGVEPDMPTLLISECCLCYMSVEEASRVIESFVNLIPDLAIVLYEPCNPNDEFGKMMTSNLSARGLSMPTVHAYPTLEDQRKRLLDAGFELGQEAADVDWLWENWISREEKQRVSALEMMDETEEWKLLARHYGVVWAWKSRQGSGALQSWGRRLPGMREGRAPAGPIPDDDDDDDDENMNDDRLDDGAATPTRRETVSEEDQSELVNGPLCASDSNV